MEGGDGDRVAAGVVETEVKGPVLRVTMPDGNKAQIARRKAAHGSVPLSRFVKESVNARLFVIEKSLFVNNKLVRLPSW